MAEVLHFLRSLTWQDLAAAAGVVFGIISTIAYLDQRRSSRGQDTLAEFARRNIDKDISEEDLKQLAAQRAAMNREVNENIPALARQAVLKEQLELHARAIAQHFNTWNEIAVELDQHQNSSAIDPTLRATILDRILPSYENERKIERLRNRITALSVALGLSGTLLPYPLSSLVAFALALPLVLSLLRFVQMQMEPTAFVNFIRQVGQVAYALVVGFAAFLVLILYFVEVPTTQAERLARLVFTAIALISAVGFWPFRRWFSPKAERLAERIARQTA